MLEYRIPLHVDYALNSLDDHLNRRRIPPLRGNGNNTFAEVHTCSEGTATSTTSKNTVPVFLTKKGVFLTISFLLFFWQYFLLSTVKITCLPMS